MTRATWVSATGAALTVAWLAASAGCAPPNPVTTTPRRVADTAFAHFAEGLASGTWEPFFAMLADDITFWFPTGKYLGEHQGKAQAMEFFRYVSSAFPGGITIVETLRTSGSGTTFVYEFRDEGLLRGEPYKNRVAISLDVCGTRICGYREYFGSDGKVN